MSVQQSVGNHADIRAPVHIIRMNLCSPGHHAGGHLADCSQQFTHRRFQLVFRLRGNRQTKVVGHLIGEMADGLGEGALGCGVVVRGGHQYIPSVGVVGSGESIKQLVPSRIITVPGARGAVERVWWCRLGC